MQTIGDRIVMLRRASEWTQAKLAKELECNVNSVANWESGRTLPNAVMIIEMSDVFGVTTDYILKGGSR